ncbi:MULTISPECIES: adenosylcobinamide-phosphate synthase CbiB [unclassified Lentimonas]|uniref:adenosylcobinamide-phosphate synthase CbiB n=1 Tax=unclassified Lentimonas TaxID=2630993 RepID=UPI0013297D5A|nr:MULTISPECIES: adenosylcobinamide-phosphate synthase CbiB [unclassified Lentimonas]CAA6679507.1 Adenosylcobinamide-phosphate synthase (EC [Lentimonas sp. CC4]CAA6687178.1 Adenosylcobinamide-phosphate synthase (EC [Lentimonas sp. CC6]CAA7075475.1 Adenosylcobinamide-phosphate synthase (EC [Lentimonas sp. CC4]CAA7170241.1 Adenosylcobinamide-phosphate synthase (EC [Lentimonas sp. CC21]CAA7182536.1 Adenosylcobinamide-phosphate synthase (EC [Lentimonas sp. CC8]
MPTLAAVLLLAVFLDLLIGDPRYALHPVRLIGHWIGVVEIRIRRCKLDNRLGSTLLYLLACTLPLALVGGLFCLCAASPTLQVLLALFILYSCLGLGDLIAHARPIIAALENEQLQAARDRVAWIVGRDVSQLDASGIARACIESLAENFVDAFLAPLCWFIFGLYLSHYLPTDPLSTASLCVLWYRTTNTLDAMVGYRNERYLQLGCISARMDDCMNFIPARLSILILTLAAALLPGLSGMGAWRIGWRDRLKHPSPNSAHPEAAVAGALGIKLGGPTQYPGRVVNKKWIGEDITASVSDIRNTCHLIITSALIVSLPLSIGLFVLT